MNTLTKDIDSLKSYAIAITIILGLTAIAVYFSIGNVESDKSSDTLINEKSIDVKKDIIGLNILNT